MMEESEKLFEMASDVWQACMDRGDFHEAILTGMSAYILLREKGSEILAPGALGLVHVAIEAAERPAAQRGDAPSCSFCGQREPDVELAAGPDAFICNRCVDTFSRVLNKK